jgi:adenylate cyclase class 2
VLRLRKDEKCYLTYKGPAQYGKTVSVRKEYEVEVSDLETTEELLNALGYQVSVRYEKWRTKYHIANFEIDLDEMPFGKFIEIEGTDPAEIERIARTLALDWNLRITESYMMLFERFKKNKHVQLSNLDFESFKDIKATPEDLGIKPADIIAYL